MKSIKKEMIYMKNKNEKLGVVFGTFAPLHKGHLSIINQAKSENDHVLVVVSGYTGDRGDLYGLGLFLRFDLVNLCFKNDSHITVKVLNEDLIPKYPDGWTPWLMMLKSLINELSHDEVNIYVGEPIYKTKINQLMPEYKVTCLNRTILPISGTMIRNNPKKHLNLIANSFKEIMNERGNQNASRNN